MKFRHNSQKQSYPVAHVSNSVIVDIKFVDIKWEEFILIQ